MSCGQDTEKAPPAPQTPKPKPEKIDSSRAGIIAVPEFSVVRKSAYDNYTTLIGDTMYTCNYKGYFESSDTSKRAVHFLFDLDVEYLIDRIYFYPIGQDRFFTCWQETDHRGIFTYFGTYARGNSKPIWIKQFRAPTPGPPVIDSNAVYVSTLGMIGKFNLDNGDAYWKHDSLFDQYKLSYKQFARPLLYTNTVCFYDFPIKGKKAKSDSIWVNEPGGKIRR